MNSFAIGLKARNNLYRTYQDSYRSTRIEKINGSTLSLPIDFHVNVWNMPRYMTSIKEATYIDIGIKASFVYDRIKLFLPFSIDKKEGCVDLIEKIKNEKVLNALFNSECILTSDKDSCFSKVIQYDRRINAEADHCKTFYLYPLGESNVIVTPYPGGKNGRKVLDGTWLDLSVVDFPSEIKTELNNSKQLVSETDEYKNLFSRKDDDKEFVDIDVLKDKYFYIRFRILVKDSKEFIISRNLSNDFLQSAFSKIGLYDLRFNEARNIHDKIKERYKDGNYIMATFQDSHIFFVGSSKIQVTNGSRIMTDSRIIEPDIWSEYEPPHNPDNIFISHHWKITPKESSETTQDQNIDKSDAKVALDIFFSVVSPSLRIGTVLLYVFVVVLLGCISSLLAIDILEFREVTSNPVWYQRLSLKQWTIILMVLYMIGWKLTDLTGSIRMWWKER